MLFRREQKKPPTFVERVESFRQAGFAAENLPDGRVKITKHGAGAIIGNASHNQPEIEKAGVLVGPEIAILLNAGSQMFLETPDGRRLPVTDKELKALHEFEEDVKEALGLVSLYNTSLGTTSQKHQYDRVLNRDIGRQPKPWETKEHRAVAPHTKDSPS